MFEILLSTLCPVWLSVLTLTLRSFAFRLHYHIYFKYWDTLSTYHTCLKIGNSPSYHLLMCLKYCCMYGKQGRPWSDTMFCNISHSDLVLHYLRRPICHNTLGYYGTWKSQSGFTVCNWQQCDMQQTACLVIKLVMVSIIFGQLQQIDILIFFFKLFFRESKVWHFVWIRWFTWNARSGENKDWHYIQSSDSHEISSLIFPEKLDKKKKK